MPIKSKSCLGMNSATLHQQGGAHTGEEIAHQPTVWRDVQELLTQQKVTVDNFMKPLLQRKDLRIILTGAGTSAFIGKCLAPAMINILQRRVEAISTTDLVAGPDLYFQPAVPTLLVSFARSGSSPESLAAVDLANELCHDVHHIVFTCNERGELFLTGKNRKNVLMLLLPAATHDRGFAMTSSFTGMLYSASLLFGLVNCSAKGAQNIGSSTQTLLDLAQPLLHELVETSYERVVYLGSNELAGLAEESALKLLELTDGQVVASFNTPLGFRHGPKTILNDRTLVVLYLTNHLYTRQYDLDLLRELQMDGRAGRVVALNASLDLPPGSDHFQVQGMEQASNLELILPYVVFAQMFAFYQSLALGITPDSPSVSGTVNRVVQGVTIYPINSEVIHVSGR